MDNIRIKGLRSLVDTNVVEIKPINILVGTNSSGKSTFLRVFPLLRQSVERKTRGPILWNGVYTDFESFLTSLHSEASTNGNEQIEFSFTFNFYNKLSFNNKNSNRENPISINTTLSIVKGTTKNSCYTNIYKVDLFGHLITFQFEEDGTIIAINSERLKWDLKKADLQYQRTNTDSLLPIIKYPDFLYFTANKQKDSISKLLYEHIINLIKEHSGSTSETKINRFASLLVSEFADDKSKLAKMKKMRSTTKWNELVDTEWKENASDFSFLAGLIDLFMVIENSASINVQFSELLRSVRYIAPLRASTERYYRYQDLSIHELEHTGSNIGIFLSNITKKWRHQLDEWTESNFNFIIKDKVTSGHISLKLEHSSSKKSDNIADMGFGYSQVLPIIIQLWAVASGYEASLQEISKPKKTVLFVIEQPELHLHPKMQASLAKVFSESIKLGGENGIDLRLVIETHSPALISKFGDMIALSEMDKDIISILMFEQNRSTRCTTLRESKFDSDGELNNWPADFFAY
ncbi:hypothetical protein AMS58_12435 [Pseudoalteromonas porphyrae]|uniref:AAA family ATPase n=1 Tax=Pseudoalteromonas TaxID=53246 RepID=UPI0006BAD06B|nr:MULTISPECIES: AAA family ATPase [Pseudoalteromonas]KPH94327.1 hypothetical protein AMS58_12435 [Pseudoalteromonas porphyrae]